MMSKLPFPDLGCSSVYIYTTPHTEIRSSYQYIDIAKLAGPYRPLLYPFFLPLLSTDKVDPLHSLLISQLLPLLQDPQRLIIASKVPSCAATQQT
jgi:hypothetical protein